MKRSEVINSIREAAILDINEYANELIEIHKRLIGLRIENDITKIITGYQQLKYKYDCKYRIESLKFQNDN